MVARQAVPPTRLNSSPTAHYQQVKDATTQGTVYSKTKLAVLNTLKVAEGQIDHLASHTGIAACAVRSRLVLSDGTFCPPDGASSGRGYQLYLTYNHLMFAPKVRLECRFHDEIGSSAPTTHTAVLEFSFSAGDGRDLDDFVVHENKTVSFTSHGATSTDLDNIPFPRPLTRLQGDIVASFSRLRTSQSEKIRLEPLEHLGDEAATIQRIIHQELPGGAHTVAKWFNQEAYSAFGTGVVLADRARLKPPAQLMASAFPMIPLPALEVFSSVKEAAVRLAYSAYTAHLEEETSLELWAAEPHKATLFHIDHHEQPILAVKFNRGFDRLGSEREEKSYRLPRELHVEAKATPWSRSDDSSSEEHSPNPRSGFALAGRLCEISGIPHSDAFFEVLQSAEELEKRGHKIHETQSPPQQLESFHFKPHFRSFTFTSFMNTISHLQGRCGASLHPLLLDSNKQSLVTKDITANSDARIVAIADRWLQSCVPWNSEQDEILSAIHAALERVVIVKGIAGTGKTLIQTMLAIYFARLGYRVLVCPPSNSNANHTALHIAISERLEKFVHAAETFDIEGKRTTTSKYPDLCRVFAGSLGHDAEKTTKRQARYAQPFHESGASSTLRSFLYALNSGVDSGDAKRHYDIEYKVLAAARAQELRYPTKRQHPSIPQLGEHMIDVWQALREFIELTNAPDFSLDDMPSEQRGFYSSMYKACKSHVLAATDILITTTGNARCTEVVRDRLFTANDLQIKTKGVIVLCDEAFKDTELATWNAICVAGDRVRGVFLFGDDMQLKPVNTTAKGGLVLGQFNRQLDLSLAMRLIRQGFPYIELKEQSRMHPCLSSFPNREFYKGSLRDSRRAGKRLTEPVRNGLRDILASPIETDEARAEFKRCVTDEQLHHHYIQVLGRRTTLTDFSKSMGVREHVDVFFDHIFPGLQKGFGYQTHQNIMVICAYAASLSLYKDKIDHLRSSQELPVHLRRRQTPAAPPSWPGAGAPQARAGNAARVAKVRHPMSLYPQVLTVDASQGQEANMVWLDCAAQHCDRLGFMKEEGRMNVALTRAKQSLFIVGGDLEPSYVPNGRFPPALKKLKDEMQRLGRVTKMKPKPKPKPKPLPVQNGTASAT